ncbi:HTH domain-containing protein [Atopobium sp. oral taxon 416]|uniref:HTH domain-containing protein n=1 Tax=Atopobium sp. oral taxon 416 TaxID=712157 RepID=UPI001BAB0FBE|nr:HTH domain-containing protein [Atopobium sp. oral taxon 416]QUC04407.1 HTH domain-containing protein [Atopobium sp. oral taxon 416]
MKKRSTEILQRLLDTPTHLLPEEVILSDYDMSDKTLRLDIREANAFTQSVDVSSKISLADGSIYLEAGFDYSQITDALSTMDLFEYKLSSEERKIYITVELLLQEGYISLQALADSMFVSRNTVVQDIKLVRYWLSKYDIEVITKGKYGVEINSSEEKQRVLLVDIFLTY